MSCVGKRELSGVFLAAIIACHVAAEAPFRPQKLRRQPIALAATASHLYVANRSSGSISRIDLATFRLLSETTIGGTLSDILVLGNRLLITDEQQHTLSLLTTGKGIPVVKQTIAIAPYPVKILANRSGTRVAVASLWSRRLTYFKWVKGLLRVERVINLTIAPRVMCLIDGESKLVVADSFDGTLAALDWETGETLALRQVMGNNIRGLVESADGKSLVISQQMLNENVPTERERVFWGTVIGNLLRIVSFEELLDAPDDEAAPQSVYHWTLVPLGRPGNAAGDPGALYTGKGGATVVLLSGVNEIGYQPENRQPMERIKVGRRPEALLVSQDGLLAFVANRFGDSVSVVDLKRRKVVQEVSLGPKPKMTLAESGEELFYSAKLSLDGWYSCNSCHTDGHTSGQVNDNFADASTGAPKKILSLLGTADTGPWAWAGSRSSLEKQVHASILQTMRGKAEQASESNVNALVAYLKTLKPAPSLAKLRGKVESKLVTAGKRLFSAKGCVDCHQGPQLTSGEAYDVGLRDEVGNKAFNPPSLRGISQQVGFLHDNRAKSLQGVLLDAKHPSGAGHSEAEIRAIIAFLKSL